MQYLGIMDVDEQIGSNLLGGEIFGTPCASPTGQEEAAVEYEHVDSDENSCGEVGENVNAPFQRLKDSQLDNMN